MMAAGTLSITLPNERDVVLTRAFNAPRAMVFEALTTPELLKRWYGPAGWTVVACEVDLRPGGRWRFVLRKPNGKEVGQLGEYREVVPGERIVNTESWEDWDAGETLVTTVLTERDGRTIYTSTITFPSTEVRDVVVKNGLERGATDSYQRLEELLTQVTPRPGAPA